MTYVTIKIDIDRLQQVLDQGLAEMYVRELIDRFGTTDHATCRHDQCQRPITRGSDGRWVHEPGGERMCRAAAYSYDQELWLKWPASDRSTAAAARHA